MPGESKENGSNNSKSLDNSVLSRRNILLAGTSLAAATAINAVDRTQVAQAQQPPQPSAASGRKPNILIIWGDDVGVANISAYSNGLMGYETPSIDRIGREGIKLQGGTFSFERIGTETVVSCVIPVNQAAEHLDQS